MIRACRVSRSRLRRNARDELEVLGSRGSCASMSWGLGHGPDRDLALPGGSERQRVSWGARRLFE